MPASAQEVAAMLAEAGVRQAFVVGSNHNLKVLAALTSAGIACMPTRCEVGAMHAADGSARVTGVRTAAVTSTGPGAGNAVGAFSTAAKDGSPVVHLTTTHFPGGARAQGVHTTVDQGGWHRAFDAPVLDAAVLDIDTIAKELAGCSGAATVVVPDDDQRRCPLPIGEIPRPSQTSAPEATAAVLDEWLTAERPLLWIGGGARGVPIDDLVNIAERTGAAVVTSIQGKDLFPPTHPNFAGCTLQSSATKKAIAAATSCLAIGSRLTEVSAAGWAAFPPHLVRVGYSNEQPPFPATRQVHLSVDAGAACDLVQHAPPARSPSSFGTESGARYRDARTAKNRNAREYQLLDAMADTLQPGDVMVCDMTKLAFWAVLAMELPTGVRWIWPGMLNMGFGLPAGIGAAASSPDRHVVVLCGDGGLVSIAPELDTAATIEGHLSVVMVDDDGYGLLRPFASEAVKSELCTFPGPEWEGLAAAFHISYAEAFTGAELESALRRGGSGTTLVRVDGRDLCDDNWREA